MAQTTVSIRMDEELKKSTEEVCRELGMNMTTAFTIFAKKLSREKRIPFDVALDPFYSESNIRYLEKKMEDYKAGRLNLAEHDLLED